MTAFVEMVSQRVLAVVDKLPSQLPSIASEAEQFTAPARSLLTGGKRSRAALAEFGWRVAGGEPAAEATVLTGSALELFQAAALIHDDVIDAAETRRGNPAVHLEFRRRHLERNGRGEASHYGISAAILLGDLMLALAEQEFSGAFSAAGPRGSAARTIWHEMITEVAVGQYLDVRASTLELPSHSSDEVFETHLAQMMTVLRHKSAHYSVYHPLRLGASLAGASPQVIRSLERIGEPLGEAFQLRDDVLGVFGDPTVTGKPAGDDLAEGKRTPLVLLGLRHSDEAQRRALLRALGNRGLSPEDLDSARAALIDSGAFAEHESLIDARRTAALQAVEEAGFAEKFREELGATVEKLTRRQH